MAEWQLTSPIDIITDDDFHCSATIAAAGPESPVDPVFEIAGFDLVGAGIMDSQYPAVENERKYDATYVESFLDDYYFRVHVTPVTFAFGPVLSEVEDEFIVWNAWFEQITCTSLIENGADEFELDDNTAPYNLAALEYKIYTVTVPKEGAADIASSIDFTFDTGEERTVLITGIRMIVFYFPPAVEIKESYQWLTDIMISKDGSEQRMSVRRVPRQSFVFDIPLKTAKIQNRFAAAMHTWAKKYFGLPVWPEKVLHTATINATDTVITVDTTFADFRDDSYALVFSDIDNYEAVKIETKTDTDLTLESGVVGTYTGSKWIIPLRIAQVSEVTNISNPVADFASAQVNFAVKDNTIITGFVADQTYLGDPVLIVASKQLGGSPKSSSINSDSFVQDYDSGDFDFLSDSQFNLNLQGWGFLNDGKEAMWIYKQFLHSLFGRQGTIWIPAFKSDLTQTETIGASDTSFRVENIKLAENMGLNDLRTHLAFIFTSGTILCRQITGIVEADEDEEIISIDSNLGLEAAVGGCRIAFLDHCRLAADEVTINHIIAYKNSSNVSFLAVKE